MRSKVLQLKAMFYAPLIVGALRFLVTMVTFIWNPQNMPWRFVQIIPLCVIIAYCFLYFKLFNDDTPVVTLLLPTIIHVAAVSVFAGSIVIIPFIVPLCIDFAFIIIKGIKSSAFPFEVDGERAEDIFEEVE